MNQEYAHVVNQEFECVMNAEQKQILAEIYASGNGERSLDSFIRGAENTAMSVVNALGCYDRHNAPSDVSDELERLVKVLDGLSAEARVHVTIVGDYIDLHNNPVVNLRNRAKEPYQPKCVKRSRWLAVGSYSEHSLKLHGITCTSAKNGHFTKYLGVIKELTGAKYSPYDVARKYCNKRES